MPAACGSLWWLSRTGLIRNISSRSSKANGILRAPVQTIEAVQARHVCCSIRFARISSRDTLCLPTIVGCSSYLSEFEARCGVPTCLVVFVWNVFSFAQRLADSLHFLSHSPSDVVPAIHQHVLELEDRAVVAISTIHGATTWPRRKAGRSASACRFVLPCA